MLNDETSAWNRTRRPAVSSFFILPSAFPEAAAPTGLDFILVCGYKVAAPTALCGCEQ